VAVGEWFYSPLSNAARRSLLLRFLKLRSSSAIVQPSQTELQFTNFTVNIHSTKPKHGGRLSLIHVHNFMAMILWNNKETQGATGSPAQCTAALLFLENARKIAGFFPGSLTYRGRKRPSTVVKKPNPWLQDPRHPPLAADFGDETSREINPHRLL
jgi:hypothetical protein